MRTEWVKLTSDGTDSSGTPIDITRDTTSDSRKEWYDEDLRRRQQEHLRQVRENLERDWQPCMHDACTECVGTGIKKDGTPCIHFISCPCPKCNPRCCSNNVGTAVRTESGTDIVMGVTDPGIAKMISDCN